MWRRGSRRTSGSRERVAAIRRRLLDVDRRRVRDALADRSIRGLHALAGNRAGDEDDLPVGARDHPAAGGGSLDDEREHVAWRRHAQAERERRTVEGARAPGGSTAPRRARAYASAVIRSRNGRRARRPRRRRSRPAAGGRRPSSRVASSSRVGLRRAAISSAARASPRRPPAFARAASSSAREAIDQGVELRRRARRTPAPLLRRSDARSKVRRQRRRACGSVGSAEPSITVSVRCEARSRGATRRRRRARRLRRSRSHRPAPRPLAVVALEVAIDARARDLERHALRRPAATRARTTDRRRGSDGRRSSGRGRFRSRGSNPRSPICVSICNLPYSIPFPHDPQAVQRQVGIDVLDERGLRRDDVGEPAGGDADRVAAELVASSAARALRPCRRSRRTAPTPSRRRSSGR